MNFFYRESNKRRLKRLFFQGRGRYLGEPLYGAVVGAELVLHRVVDVCLPAGDHDSSRLNGQLTAVIKTFERPQILRRLVDSIRRFYPDLPLIVVDDSREPKPLAGVETVSLPYDSGVAAGRNAGVERVNTPYLLMLDDDFVFYRKTRLKTALASLCAHPEIDIMAGVPVDLPFYRVVDYRKAGLFPNAAAPVYPPESKIGGMTVLDKVPQFFIARTDSIRKVMWDPRLKRIDHADFFTRAKGVLTSVLNPDMRCLHARTLFDEAYMRIRHDAADFEYLRDKYHEAGKN